MAEPVSQSTPIVATLIEALRAAGKDQLPQGWLFLREGEITADTESALIANVDVGHVKSAAATLGFPIYGLDTRFLKIIVESAEDSLYPNPPSDDDLMQAYLAQLEFDEESSVRFYESLGEERAEVPCRNPGCRRGAITLSVFCRLHHFEEIQRRPCPFE